MPASVPLVCRIDRASGTVNLTRILDAPADEVWTAITEPDHLAQWLGRVVGEPLERGQFIEIWHDATVSSHHRVLEWDPPSVLELSWRFPGEPPSRVRFTVTSLGPQETELALVHSGLAEPASYAAGWHRHSDYLRAHLAGEYLAWEEFWDGHEDLVGRYRSDTYAGAMDGLLPGGNMNEVERAGDTVLRNAGRWTPTVHRYLDYLAVAGVTWVPRALGIDGNRERLSFVDGEVPLYPLPAWVWQDTVLEQGAQHLRQLHDASIGFGSDGAVWQAPAKVPAEVICHNDFAPHNLAFLDGSVVGAIDFDMCSPGPRIWDIAYFATRAVPLTASTPANAPGMNDARRRVDLILSAYGSDASWSEVLRVAIIRLYDLARMSIEKADELGKPHLLDEAEEYERDARFLRDLGNDNAGPQ